jgi:photosynthetic reaction center cytochrome c subunit
MKSVFFKAPRMVIMGAALMAAGLLAGCDAPPQESTQSGYRGTGAAQIDNKARVAAKREANAIPEAQPAADGSGDKASKAYQNVKVLGHLSEGQFLRVMTAMTEWIAPNEGCGYCHNLDNLADDKVYTKVVARRMIQMTQDINTNWTNHVGQTGVTCYTCHRGQPVPNGVWFSDKGPETAGFAASPAGQNMAAPMIDRASLPRDPFTPLLLGKEEIRVGGNTALATGEAGAPIQRAEQTYSLMVHMSTGLGVNCTFCHNSRAFGSWEESTPQRATAWHGIRMVRDLNNKHIVPLQGTFPANRLGPEGDVAKVGCTTCHQGVNKPLYGVSMLKDYLAELGPVKP